MLRCRSKSFNIKIIDFRRPMCCSE